MRALLPDVVRLRADCFMPTVAPISVTVAGPSKSRKQQHQDGSINITDEPNTARVRVGDRRRLDACRLPARIKKLGTFGWAASMHGYARRQQCRVSRVAGPAGPPARLGNRPTPVNDCPQDDPPWPRSGTRQASRVRDCLHQHDEREPMIGQARHCGRHPEPAWVRRTRSARPRRVGDRAVGGDEARRHGDVAGAAQRPRPAPPIRRRPPTPPKG